MATIASSMVISLALKYGKSLSLLPAGAWVELLRGALSVRLFPRRGGTSHMLNEEAS